MPAGPATATMLLPARQRVAAQALPQVLGQALARADRLPDGAAGAQAQLQRHFELLPRGWPVAALTRQHDARDAAGAAWLRADPAHVRPDMTGARVLGVGDALRLAQEDVDAFLPALRPLFGDAGVTLDAPAPSRWYLRLPREAQLPAFAMPDDALGADLFEHLPEGDLGRRWRALMSEAQVVLHNHPRNAERAAQGLPQVNSLWFWGAGVLPDSVRSVHQRVRTDEVLLGALAAIAGATADAGPLGGSVLLDHRALDAFDASSVGWVEAALRGEIASLTLDFADGARFAIARRQRWRLWRQSTPQWLA